MTEDQAPTLQSRIDADLKQAMRDKDETAKLTLRSIKTALTEARTADAAHQLTPDDELTILQREAKALVIVRSCKLALPPDASGDHETTAALNADCELDWLTAQRLAGKG